MEICIGRTGMGCRFGSSEEKVACTGLGFCGNATMATLGNGTQPAYLSCKYNSACAGEGTILPLSTLSVWWQILPYTFVGLGEVFTAVSMYELFYDEVDASMRSVSQGVGLLTGAYGSFAASPRCS